MEKKTKVQIFTQILENYQLTDEESKLLTHEIELLNKKSAARKNKPTPKQVANKTIGDKIYEAMVNGTNYTYGDLKELVPDIMSFSPQRITAILSPYASKNIIKKSRVKGVIYITKI